VTTPDQAPDPPPLTKAVLYKLKDSQPAGKGKPPSIQPDGQPITVQFNPTSLKIQRQNNIDKGGSTALTQHRQNPSQQSATLSFDLEFDTAEGDQSGNPLDVRALTAQVRQFVEPDPAKPAGPPPRVLFLWGALAFPGIITQLTEDLDYFARDGMALRAKLSVTITEQNPAFEAMSLGAGARTDTGSTPPGGGSATATPSPLGPGPGGSGTNNPVQVALAQAGESIQQLLTRLDQDPSAWRSAMNGLSSPLSLTAGAQVQLAASASLSAGIGVSAGFAAGASAGITAGASASGGVSAVLSAGASATAAASADASAAFSAGADVDVVATAGASATATAFAGASASAAAGFALAAGGGVGATYNRALGAQIDAAVGSARASFAVPAASQTASVTAGASSVGAGTAGAGPASVGVTGAAVASVGGDPSTQPADLVVQVDARAVTFGRGIPLSARADVATVADSQTGGQAAIGARVPTSEISLPSSPGTPPWQGPPT
jgi:Contractile injection system tube protein